MELELKQIEQLAALVVEKDLKRLRLKLEGGEIELEARCHGAVAVTQPAMSITPHPAAMHLPHSAPVVQAAKQDGPAVKSPMVGTFYKSPAPGEPTFVKPGDRVNADTVIGIIEAMKVMNEVKAGQSGTVKEFLVDDAQPVEYGTALIRIQPE